jgi:hypothetical protein
MELLRKALARDAGQPARSIPFFNPSKSLQFQTPAKSQANIVTSLVKTASRIEAPIQSENVKREIKR